jgi:hypothetical protein
MLQWFGEFFAGLGGLAFISIIASLVLFLVNPKSDDAITVARFSLAVLIVSACCLFFCAKLA